MPRYVIIRKPQRLDWVDEYGPTPVQAPTVFVSEDPVPTGLKDKDGNDLYRVREPVGFIVKDDRSS